MLVLTNRDRVFLGHLCKYGVLSTRQVIEGAFPEIRKTTVLRRLRKLEKGALIRRVRGLSDGSFAWCLGAKGEKEAGEGLRLPRVNPLSLNHDVRLVDVRRSLERAGLGENWVSERNLRQALYSRHRSDEDLQLIPDAIFSGHLHNGNVRAVAVELELHGKKLSRYEKIFRRYRLRSQIAVVWYFVESVSFGQRLQEKWTEVVCARPDSDASLGFTLIADVIESPRKARIHFWRTSNTVEEFFRLTEPAHGDAQGVSTQNDTAA